MAILSILLDHIPELVILLLVILWLKQKTDRRRFKLPPGPTGVPILGYIPFVNEQTIHHDLMLMSQKYGSKILHMKLGFDDVIV